MNDRWEELSTAILRQSKEKDVPKPHEAELEFQTDVARVAWVSSASGTEPDWLGGSAMACLRAVPSLQAGELW